ncbi:MAG: nucleotidyl transferase AbiEii/AbiGii toxin family protein [Deltaproteobacteria bacterium]|nr:nucleotidyl transferase AbiEii/AbiGii toxin family protein [Deltaproteobacteria bacterium]
MLIGGQAVLVHGQPRLTEDIDITLGIDPTQLGTVLDVCSALALDPIPEDVEGFVTETFVLPALHGESGIRIDFIFSTTSYEREAIARAEHHELAGVPIPFATAEDLIIHKLFAGRARDWEDAVSIVRRKREGLDWEFIMRWAVEFAQIPGREEMPAQVDRLRQDADR